ncbi:MAG: M20/M25/M40 family metallo-hydrolase [Candidatus Lokiarchaeota archaeon]|nr:M20/M25/M40 family metallo-hydrolase [Candidatus Lokiarchaeota archaeon]
MNNTMNEDTFNNNGGENFSETLSKFHDVVELTRNLVKINSENPIHCEVNVQNFLVSIIEKLGFEYDIIPFSKDRNNVVATFPPSSAVNSQNFHYIMFSGHMDTVLGYEITRSENAPLEDGKIYGRGSCDMKGGIASFLTAISHFTSDYNLNDLEQSSIAKMKKGICVVFTVDEEMGCAGIKALENYDKMGNDFHVDLCINAEPSSLSPVIGHKGIVWIFLDFKGKMAHASVPFLGDNAIEKASKFILALEPLKKELQTRTIEEYPIITPPTISVGVIKGGDETNIVPDNCRIQIDRRLTLNETGESALNELKEIAKQQDLIDDIEFQPIRPKKCYIAPKGTQNEHYLALMDILSGYKTKGAPFMEGFTEAAFYYEQFGITAINLGPGSIEQAHKPDEYVEVDELLKACEIYYKILEKYILEK